MAFENVGLPFFAREQMQDPHCYLDNEKIEGDSRRSGRKTVLTMASTVVTVNEGLLMGSGPYWIHVAWRHFLPIRTNRR
jgi:hypothetical protein